MIKVWYLILTTAFSPNVDVMVQHIPIFAGEGNCMSREHPPTKDASGYYHSARCESRLMKKRKTK